MFWGDITVTFTYSNRGYYKEVVFTEALLAFQYADVNYKPYEEGI
jgi:hypothetical protein